MNPLAYIFQVNYVKPHIIICVIRKSHEQEGIKTFLLGEGRTLLKMFMAKIENSPLCQANFLGPPAPANEYLRSRIIMRNFSCPTLQFFPWYLLPISHMTRILLTQANLMIVEKQLACW